MKIKEGGGMDILEEKEAFENHLKKMGKTDNETFSKNEDDSYQMDIIHFGWKIWQAAKARMEVRINTLDEMLLNQGEALAQAKAQAVPEGFVLVPKEPKDKTIARMINTPIEVNLLCDHADIFLSEGEAYIAYQAMIEAQEPAND